MPLSAFWEITDACNLRCIHCESDAGHAAPDELTTAEAETLADALASAGCRHVCLTGGEPLVRPDWVLIAKRLCGRGVDTTVISNGILVDESVLTAMREVGVTGLSVSIDGSRGVHDAIRVGAPSGTGSVYDRALRAIELGKRAGLKVAVITQVHQHNLAELAAMHDLLAELEVDAWQVQICMPLGRLLRFREKYLLAPHQVPELERTLAELIDRGEVPIVVADNIGYFGPLEPKLRGSSQRASRFWVGCMAGCRVVAIRANGDVKGCPSHPREFVVGNVRERAFAAIWARGEAFAYNTAFREELLEGACAECAYRRICRAGCTSMAYAVTGIIYDNPFCVQRAAERAPDPARRRLHVIPSATRAAR